MYSIEVYVSGSTSLQPSGWWHLTTSYPGSFLLGRNGLEGKAWVRGWALDYLKQHSGYKSCWKRTVVFRIFPMELIYASYISKIIKPPYSESDRVTMTTLFSELAHYLKTYVSETQTAF